MDRKKLKAKALKNLKGNYGPIVLGTLLYAVISGICSGIANFVDAPLISIVLWIIATGLFYMGFIQIVVKTANKKKTSVKELFERTDLFFRCMALTMVFMFVNVLCSVLEFTALNSLATFINYQSDLNIAVASFMIVVGVVLSAAIDVFWIIMNIYLSQSYFILYDYPDMPLNDILMASMDMMEGHKKEFLVLNLSFIGWGILGIFTCGLLYLWLIPYVCVANYYFYDKVKDGIEIIEE